LIQQLFQPVVVELHLQLFIETVEHFGMHPAFVRQAFVGFV